MSSEEEKEQPGQDTPGAGEAGEELAAADPLAGAEAAAEAEAEADGANETGEEKKERKFWPMALGLMLLVLAGGGYYALTGLNSAAHKLGGGSDFDRLASNSEIYDGSAAGHGARAGNDYFPLDEEEARKAAYRPGAEARRDRMNRNLLRGKGELASDANAGASGGDRDIPQALRDVHQSNAPAPAADDQQPGAMAEKLKARAAFTAGRGGQSRGQAVARNTSAFEGAGALAGRSSVQSETAKGSPRQGGKGGVMDSLKGAFRATFYGARLSSQDSARGWISRAFDGSAEAGTAIEYDEKMRSKLDRVNPDSIPGFLRDQDVSSAEAKRLAVNDPGKPKLDKDGTYDALQKDKGYQQKKLASDFGNSMLNGMFAGLNGGSSDKDRDSRAFSDPGDEETLDSLALGDFLQSTGHGEECGCSAAAACCCLPQNYFSQQQNSNSCPMYGPFLPNDPCGAAMYGGNAGLTGATVSP